MSLAIQVTRYQSPIHINREEREKLLRQIEQLEKRCRTEKQTRKKYELHQQIMKLKEEVGI